MKIVFFSNFLNHHQLPLCRAFINKKDVQFTFVSTEPIPQSRLDMNYEDMNKKYPFVLCTYETDQNKKIALQLAEEADIVIVGSAPMFYVKDRLKKYNKLTFRFCERSLKKGEWRRFIPRTRKKIVEEYIQYKNNNLYVLGASAYTSNDLAICGFPIEKCYKWGYFPKTKRYSDIKELIRIKHPASILWVARLITLKHPEVPILVAKKLKEEGYSFELNLVGSGELESTLQKMISDYQLQNYVNLRGTMTPDQVRKYMEESQIFLFTSDRNEGWGAVVNEAMNSGCAVVASHAIGSVPFLLKDKENGLIYQDGNIEDLYKKVKMLLDNDDICSLYGEKAYKTITDQWNAEVAVERLLKISQCLLEKNHSELYLSGPCSFAPIYKNNWYRG